MRFFVVTFLTFTILSLAPFSAQVVPSYSPLHKSSHSSSSSRSPSPNPLPYPSPNPLPYPSPNPLPYPYVNNVLEQDTCTCVAFNIGSETGCPHMCNYCETKLGLVLGQENRYYFTENDCVYEQYQSCIGNPVTGKTYTCCIAR